MHKFVQRSRVGIFRNERTRSTPLDLKLMFWGILDISLLHELQCKMVEREQSMYKFVQRSRVVIFRNGRTRSTLLDPKLMFWGVSNRFRYCTNFGAKQAELVPLIHNFVHRSRVGIFRTHPIQHIGPQAHVL
jgi:hypothetical protein